jgi:hypothetical protein
MKNIFIFCGLLFLVASCNKYPSDSVSSEEADLIGSLYDQNADFSSYKTFAIVDSVIFIKNEAGEGVLDSGVSRYSDRIISSIAQNMTSRGYIRVSKDSAPDLGIDASILSGEFTGSYTYWGGYPSYWGWYGYSYWYSYPQTGYYQFEIGSIIMNMVDLKNRNDTDKELRVIWNNFAVGLLSQTTNANGSRVDRAINTMFEQSPYIKK